jgi:hypothetical protein
MTGCSVLLRRSALLAVGGRPPKLEWHPDSFAYLAVGPVSARGWCGIRSGRSGPGPYWPRGVRDPVSQGVAIAAMLDLLAQPRFRDVRVAFRRCPEHFLPWRIPMWWSSCADGATGTSGWRT